MDNLITYYIQLLQARSIFWSRDVPESPWRNYGGTRRSNEIGRDSRCVVHDPVRVSAKLTETRWVRDMEEGDYCLTKFTNIPHADSH